jgi:hypothetical protein
MSGLNQELLLAIVIRRDATFCVPLEANWHELLHVKRGSSVISP